MDEIKTKKNEFHNTPKYLYRPSHYSVYQMIDTGEYIRKDFLNRNWISNTYSFQRLINSGFKPCTKDDFEFYKEKRDEYYEYISWSHQSDGHGGVMGGTFEEFLANKKQK